VTPDFSQLAGDLAPGDRVASYLIQEQIGVGGMAVVFRALDLRLDRQVALKVLAPRLAEDEAFRQRFIRESRAAAGVDHPHIIPVFEAGEAGGVLFIAMRYVAFGDVRTLIEAERRLSSDRVTEITGQVASALDAAHAHGLIHRDVKPGNILIAATGGSSTDHVYLSDFGLSKTSLASSTLTSTGQFMGTLDYVSPEQIQGQPADGRADQYALACTVVEMLSGAPPYKRDESMALLWAQLEAPPPDLRERLPDLPPEVNVVISRALAKSPADRYPTCLAFASALRAAFGPAPARPRGPQTELASAAAEPSGPRPPRPGPAAWTRADPVPDMAQPEQAVSAAADVQPERTPTARVPAQGQPMAGTALPRADRVPPGPRHPGGGTVPLADGRSAPARPRQPEYGQPAYGPPAQRGPAQRPMPVRRGRGGRVLAVIALIAAVGGLAFGGYKLLHKTAAASTPPPAPATQTQAAASPAQTVEAYFAAINAQNFRKAWHLVGDKGPSYEAFAKGFTGTSHDTLKILSVSGDVVTAQLLAAQTDGTVKTYQGSYTVTGGVITSSDVQQVG
jgi:Protein kinase domain